MANAKHTPLPWGYDGDGFDSVAAQDFDTDGYTIFPVDEDGICTGHICEMSEVEGDDEAEANAAFIVRACNSHYLLLNALKELVAFSGLRHTPQSDHYLRAARIAISLAEAA